MFESLFLRRKVVPARLLDYGFLKKGGEYVCEREILNGAFCLEIRIGKNGPPNTRLIEEATGEEYVLYKTAASGSFVGEVRAAVGDVLSDIADKCFEAAVFKGEQALRIIEYVRERYGGELEFLWEKSPCNAVWRRKDNRKWFGILLTIPQSRLGMESDEPVEIIDLKAEPDMLKALVDSGRCYPGWHMNKKHWYTVVLDGSVPTEELCGWIDASYSLAK